MEFVSTQMILKKKTILTTVCAKALMEVLQELLDLQWTWTVELIVSEVQQHVDLNTHIIQKDGFGLLILVVFISP